MKVTVAPVTPPDTVAVILTGVPTSAGFELELNVIVTAGSTAPEELTVSVVLASRLPWRN